MGDTQKLGYLLSAIRHEKDLQSVYSQLQSDQLRGAITFDQACLELHHRCDAIRADELLDSTIRSPGKTLGLLSNELKRHNRKGDAELVSCLSKDCEGKIVAFLQRMLSPMHGGENSGDRTQGQTWEGYL